jgi:hypothetical protein
VTTGAWLAPSYDLAAFRRVALPNLRIKPMTTKTELQNQRWLALPEQVEALLASGDRKEALEVFENERFRLRDLVEG